MIIKCSDENLRGMVRDAESLRDDINDISYYAGYYLIAEKTENIDGEEITKEICIAINKWFEKDPDIVGKVHHGFNILILCDCMDTFEEYWSDWDTTDELDPNELFDKLKEIRDNITEDSFNAD